MNKTAVIIGAVMIVVTLGIALFSFFHSPELSEDLANKKLAEMTAGEFASIIASIIRGIIWQAVFADVIGTCGIIITAMGLFIRRS